jgi:hypothetical protein
LANPANARYQQAQAAIQQTMSNQLAGVQQGPGESSGRRKRLSQAALSRESSSVFGLYMGLKKEDGSPLDLSASDHQRDLDRIISDRKFQAVRQAHAEQELKDSDYHREAKIGWQNYLAKRKEDDPNFTFMHVTTDDASKFAATLPPQTREQFFNDVAQQYYSANNMTQMFRTEESKKLLMDNAVNIASGKLNNDPQTREALYAALLNLGDVTAVHQVGVASQFAGKQFPPQTTEEALHAWYDLRDSGKPVTKTDVDSLIEKYDGQVSKEDFSRMYDHTFLQHHESQARSEPIYQRAATTLMRQINTKFVDDRLASPGNLPEEILKAVRTGDPTGRQHVEQIVGSEPSFLNAAMDARNELGRTYERMIRDPEMKKMLTENPEGFESELLKRVDDISTNVGGYNAEQFKGSQAKLLTTFKEPKQAEPEVPAKLYPPGSPEHALSAATINKLLPDYALLPNAQQEKVNAILAKPPVGLSEAQREQLAPPADPHSRYSTFHAPTDTVGQLSKYRNNLRDIPTLSQGEAPSLGTLYLKKKFAETVGIARAEAGYKEISLPTNLAEKYKQYTDLADKGGTMAPANWAELRKMENQRIEAVYLRQGAGYDPIDVKQLMENGDKEAWKTKAMFIDLDDFHPSNAKKLMETMQYLGLDPKDKITVREFLARQQQLTAELIAQQ